MNARFLKSWLAFLALALLSFNLWARGPVPLNDIAIADLPKEARYTLQLIKDGKPMPYPKDGVVFGNYEGVLPKQKRGYYHEYTVKTPGVRSRGARRIVTGGEAGRGMQYFYTDDHYASFRRIKDEFGR